VKALALFDSLVSSFDAWFDSEEGRPVFDRELEAIRRVESGIDRDWLEVGVGTGRFARSLGIGFGIDPSIKSLELAATRNIRVVCGTAENIPLDSGRFPGVLMVVTLCFVTDPEKALQEAARVIKVRGRLVVAIVPGDSAWGRKYIELKNRGHPFYSRARFYSTVEVREMAHKAGLTFMDAKSCLFTGPNSDLDDMGIKDGDIQGAGFVSLVFKKGTTRYGISVGNGSNQVC